MDKLGKVLFVDDDLDTCEMIQHILEGLGYEADFSTDGVSALSKLEQEAFTLVITDMCMPHMSGLELCRRIRKKYNHLKVILLTGYGNLETALQAMTHGAHNFLTKPISIDQMGPLLSKTLAVN